MVAEGKNCDRSAASFAKLKMLIAKEVPKGVYRDDAMKRIERSLDPEDLKGEDEMATIWAAREREAPSPKHYAKGLAEQWREVGCAPEGAPYVLHNLIDRLSKRGSSPFRDQSDGEKALAAAFLDEAHCPGAHGLSEFDKAELKKIRDAPAPQAPKP